MSLLKLPMPEIVERIAYEDIVARKTARLKEILAQKGIEYAPNEADDLMTLIELDAYEEMLLRTQLNERIKQQFLAYATGSNLDHIGTTRFGIERLQGKKPTAAVRFTLSTARGSDTIIPHGLLLGDGEHTATLQESVVIRAGETSGEGVMELELFARQSDVRCETILTPLPWVVEAKQLTPFDGGADAEDDERYRVRIWLGRERKSTAGSRQMYAYHAKSADVRVSEVAVRNGGAGVVEVAVLGENFATEPDLVAAVEAALSAEAVRPLTDTVVVSAATVNEVSVEATLYAKQIEAVDTEAVKQRFAPFAGKLGAKLTIAKVYDLLQDDNIVDVSLASPTQTVVCAWDEAMRFRFTLSVEAAA